MIMMLGTWETLLPRGSLPGSRSEQCQVMYRYNTPGNVHIVQGVQVYCTLRYNCTSPVPQVQYLSSVPPCLATDILDHLISLGGAATSTLSTGKVAVLYCSVLFCIVLYCHVLYCIVLYCHVLSCIVLVLSRPVLSCTLPGAPPQYCASSPAASAGPFAASPEEEQWRCQMLGGRSCKSDLLN